MSATTIFDLAHFRNLKANMFVFVLNVSCCTLGTLNTVDALYVTFCLLHPELQAGRL